MENWQPADLSWSYSQKTHIDSCRRHYFYHRFWGQDAKSRWKIYEMRCLSTLPMLGGLVAHIVIAECLNEYRLGNEISSNEAKQRVTDIIRQLYMESAKKLWLPDNRPKGKKMSEITNLIEHYYNLPNTTERAKSAQHTAQTSVCNLIESSYWQELTKSPRDWIVIEEEGFPHFDLEGIKVYSKIDFAHKIGSPTIIDWKTGASNQQERNQVTLYALYAQFRWGWKPLDTTLQVVHLQPSLEVTTFKPTQDDIEAVKREVKASFEQMTELEPAYGPADINNFPITDDLWNCARCRFQGICPGGKRLEETDMNNIRIGL